MGVRSQMAVLLAIPLIAGSAAVPPAIPREVVITSILAIPIVVAARYLSSSRVALVAASVAATALFLGLSENLHLEATLTDVVALAVIGYLTAMLARQREVTRAAAEQARQTSDLLRTLIDTIPAGVLVSDERGQITLENPAAVAILGQTAPRDSGELLHDYRLFRPDGSPFLTTELPLFRAIESGEVTRDLEILVRCRDGGERIILAAGSPVRDRSGRITGAVAVFQDVTTRMRAVKLLEERERRQVAIADFGRSALAGVDVTRLMDDAAAIIARLFDVEYVEVLELVPDRSELLLRTAIGWPSDLVGHPLFEAGSGSLAGYALLTNQSVTVANFQTETRFRVSPLIRERGIVSGIAAVVEGQPDPFGVLSAESIRERSFTADDVSFAEGVAMILAMAIGRARTEDTLRRQATIIDQIHDAVVSTDLDGRLTSWNQGAERLFGYPATEVLGRHIRILFPPEAYPGGLEAFVEREVIRPLERVGQLEVEFNLRRKSGESLIADARLSLLRNGDGAPIGVIGYLIDVTQREAAAEALRRTEERLRAVVTNAPIVFFALDERGVFTLSEGKGLETLGLKPGQVVGQSVFDLYRNEPTILQHAHQALAGEEFTAVDAVSHPRSIWETRWSPLRDARGNLRGVIGVATDVTERVHAEQERERLLARERAMAQIAQALVRELGLAPVVDVVVDQSQRVLGADVVGVWLADTTHRVLDLLSYRGKSPAVAKKMRRVPFDAPSISALAARTQQVQLAEDIAASEPSLTLLREVAAAEGMRSAVAIPLISRGRLVGVVTYASHLPRYFTSHDVQFNVTVADLFAVAIENAHLYDEVRRTLRLREEFLAAAAHELRTPITVIRGNSQLLLKTDAVEPRVRGSLETILRHADRVTLLVDDLLTIAKVRPGLIQLNRSAFDLGSLVQSQTEAVARTTDRHQFAVDVDRPLTVDADRHLIAEVIRRLLENALRYSPDGGSIQVAAQKQNHQAVVSVTDHGVGIPIERQSHAFEPFYELVPAGLPGYVGMVSLGLTVSKQIVNAHGGRIWLRSKPGQGSTFSFSLPLRSGAT